MEADWVKLMNDAMEVVRQSGWLGWLWFTIIYVLTCVFFLPGSVLTLGAGAVYGWLCGTVLVTLASTAGAAVNFLTSRYVARGWIERKLGRAPRFLALEHAIERQGSKLIFLSRLSPIVPHSLVSYAAGLTRISLARYTAASFVGFIPLSAVYVYAGAVLGRVANTRGGWAPHDLSSWILTIAGAAVTIAVIAWSIQLAAQAMSADPSPDAGDDAERAAAALRGS